MMNSNMEIELLKFNGASERGYMLANEKYSEIALALRKAEHNAEIINSRKNQIQGIRNETLFDKQKEEFQEIKNSVTKIREDIEFMHERLQDFSVVIFGREGVGKSTLMGILLNDDGKTVAKNKKIKAREVREYSWKGLKITDFPDLKFFNNTENDKIGFEAAKTADLILFLITNEEPQPEEAQCFAQLKSLGKPVLCVVNVKKNLNFKKREHSIKELDKIFSNDNEIKSVAEKFKSLDDDYDKDLSEIKFVAAHFAAAYFAQSEKNNDEELYEASRFSEVENFILDKFHTDGIFLRVKNFVDCVAVPLNNILLKIFEHSAESFKECKVWTQKQRQTKEFRHTFWEKAQSELYKLFDQLSQNLNYEIQQFVEENYDAKDISEKWDKHVQEFGYIERYQQLVEKYSKECEDGLQNLSKELADELYELSKGNTLTNINFEEIHSWTKDDEKVPPNLLKVVQSKGWAANITAATNSSIFPSFFESKENKIRNAKDKLYKQLKEVGFRMLSKINNSARDVLTNRLMKNIDDFSNIIASYALLLGRLGESQSNIAETFIDEYSNLNTVIFDEAASYSGGGSIHGIRATMRIPGEISIVISEDTFVNTRAISELLDEKFYVIEPLNNWEATMKKVLKCDFKLNSYQLEFETDNKAYSVTPQDKVNPSRLKLAQQISPYPLMV